MRTPEKPGTQSLAIAYDANTPSLHICMTLHAHGLSGEAADLFMSRSNSGSLAYRGLIDPDATILRHLAIGRNVRGIGEAPSQLRCSELAEAIRG